MTTIVILFTCAIMTTSVTVGVLGIFILDTLRRKRLPCLDSKNSFLN